MCNVKKLRLLKILKSFVRKRKIKDSEWIKFFLIIKITMSTILKFKEFSTITKVENNGSYDKDIIKK